MAQDTSPEPTAQMGKGATDGQAHELTAILQLKHGGADRTREVLKLRTSDEARSRRDAMGNLHDMRVVFFDRVASNIPVFHNSMSTYGIELHRDPRWLEAIGL